MANCQQIFLTPWQNRIYSFFGTKIRLSRAEKFEVTCDGNILYPTTSVKYFGITLDEDSISESVAQSSKRCVVDYVSHTDKVTFWMKDA